MQQPRSSTATKSELLVTGFRLRFTNMKKKKIYPSFTINILVL